MEQAEADARVADPDEWPAPASVAQAIFDGFNRERVQGLIKHLHPDVVWTSDPTVPEPGVYSGATAVAAYLVGLVSPFEAFRIEPLEYIERGDEVLAITQAYGRNIASPVELVLVWCLLFTVRDGRAVFIRSFLAKDEALQYMDAR
jgi:ketosteroid isomerase-like protein